MRFLSLLFVLLAGSALAQPADPAESAYQEGRRLYDVQDWDGAIAKFKEAYKLRPDARSLFNIAQAYRLKGDCTQAQSFYRTYKRNFPDAANIATVDKFLAEPCAKDTAPLPEPEQPADKPSRSYTLPIAFGAGAVVLVGGALGFELSARGTYDRALAAQDEQQQHDLWQSANTQRYVADGLVVGGIACTGVAVWLFIRSRRDEPAVQPQVSAHAASLVITGRF
jgi:tetratricopeptide (TPR) repeat protein